MALKNLSFIKYLEAAFRHKLFKDSDATYFNYLGYNLHYKRIFYYARKVLPYAYTNEFADSDEGNLQMAKAVIERLDREGKDLGVFIEPSQTPQEYDLVVTDAQTQSQQAEALQTGQPVAGGEAAGTMLGGIPSVSVQGGMRTIRVPQTKPPVETVEAPESKLYVADKSGRVIEERTITPTSTTVAKPEAQSKLFIADKGGRVVGERVIKNVGSGAQVGIKRGITRAGTSLSGMLGGVGRGLGGILGGIGSGGVRLLGGAGGALSNIGTQMTRSRGLAISGKKFLLIFLGGFLLVGGLAAFAPAPAPVQPTPGQPSPIPPPPIAGPPIPPGPLGFSLSCPISGDFSISCGTAANHVGGCGHGVQPVYNPVCNPYYYVCIGDKYSDALYHAIDVKPRGGNTSVVLPFINGNESLEWTRTESDPIPIGRNAEWGYRVNFTANYREKELYLDLTHLNQDVNSKRTLNSGESVGAIFAGIGHVHTAISVDRRWIEPVQEVNLCTRVTPPSLAINPISIGDGSRGTSITGYKIGNGPTGVAIVGSIHGKWEDAARQLVEAAKDALGNKSINLPNNLTVYLIPVINVDSLTTNTSDGKAAFNANSVDLNRNFDSASVPGGAWRNLTCAMGKYQALGAPAYSCEGLEGTRDANSIFPQFCSDSRRIKNQIFYCAEGYSGSGPLSEPESQSLANFLTGNNIKIVLSYHAPFKDITISNGGQRINGAQELAQLVASTTGLPYHDFWPYYPVTGQLMDWLQDKGIIGVEVELPGPAVSLSDKDRQLNAVEEALIWTSNKFK